jgi:hypothetical protein
MDSDRSAHMSELVKALERLEFVTVVRTEEAASQLRLLCRVTNKKAWCVVLERLLQDRRDWTAHICQQYFVKDGSLVYGWNFIVNADDKGSASKDICRLLTVPQRVEVDTFPLRGAWRTSEGSFNPRAPGARTGGSSQKGAFPISTGDK